MSKYFFFLFILTANTFGLIRNYENSENLKNAMIYCPSYARDKDLVDRDKAVSFYKAYLEEYPHSINRAKVLSRIGMNYAQYEDEEKGVSRNYDIARDYFRKSIEVDPDFVCYETIVARTNLASIAERGDKRFSERLKVCKWLESVSDDQIRSSVKKEIKLQGSQHNYVDAMEEQKQEMMEKLNAIKSSRANSNIERSVKEVRSTLSVIKKSAETNLLYGAFSTTVPEASLRRIIVELHGTEIAERAAQELVKLMDLDSELYLPDLPDMEQFSNGDIAQDSSVRGNKEPEIAEPIPGELSVEDANDFENTSNSDDTLKENKSNIILLYLLGIVCIVVTICFVIKIKKKK